jgi:hypothetical protein
MGKNKEKSKAGQPEVPIPFQHPKADGKQQSGHKGKGDGMRPEVVIPVGIANQSAEKKINVRKIGENDGEYP